MKSTKKQPVKQAASAAQLAELATQANLAHAACEQAIQSAIEQARTCGDALIQAKALVGHGNFETWITSSCKFTPRMARRYMTIAAGWEHICDLSKRTRVSDMPLDSLSMREALKLLSAHGPEDYAVVYLDQTCPSCGERLAVTSNLFATCAACWDCRLYPLGFSGNKKRFARPQAPAKARENPFRFELALKKLPTSERAETLADAIWKLTPDDMAEIAHIVANRSDRGLGAGKQLKRLVKQCQDAIARRFGNQEGRP